MIEVFRKFGMNIVGISETKWFGQDKYEVGGYLILRSGRPIPTGDEAVERNEGVGIVLDPGMARLWKDSGEVWKPISSRIVSARLKLSDKRRPTASPVFLSIVSVYAPTHRASQEDKNRFFDDLQAVVDSVCAEDLLLVVGDFNARVGCGARGDLWDGVRGQHC